MSDLTMAVLVEAISVIVRCDAIKARYPGGWEAFRHGVPNVTLASDMEIARVGFMTPTDVEAYVRDLEIIGLVFIRDGGSIDIAVVDQQRGLTKPCAWLDWGHVSIDGGRVAACRLKGSKMMTLATPEGWKHEGSLSHTYGFVPTGSEAKSLELIETREGTDVYRDRLTGRLVYVGRTR
jgi:hypothetical protein